MKHGMSGRVLVGAAVVLAAVPAIVLSASSFDAVVIQAPPAAVQRAPPAPIVITLPRQQIKQLKVDRVKALPVALPDGTVVAQVQEQEAEPWRSTKRESDAEVVVPTLTYQTDPKYTPEAMRAKIQGMVSVEVIVSQDGNVTAARVIQSLDKDYGLDDEAVKTAMQWKFVAGTYQGQPVAIRVMINMEFQLR